MPLKFFGASNGRIFFQEMDKTKFHAMKIYGGPLSNYFFELLLDMYLGVQFCIPPPNKNRFNLDDAIYNYSEKWLILAMV